MTVEQIEGTAPRLYALVAPLVMRRSILRQNNNYPFWTSRAHRWFVALDESGQVAGFMPVECGDGGTAKIDNYYVSGDDAALLTRLLREAIRCCAPGRTIRSVTHLRHEELFRAEGFRTVRRWRLYVAMEREKSDGR